MHRQARTTIRYIGLILLFGVSLTSRTWAHSMHQSAVLLDFKGNAVDAELQLPVDRLVISFRQPVDEQDFPTLKPALATYVLQHLHPVTPDGKAFTETIESLALQTVENAPYLVVHVRLVPPKGSSVDQFTLNYDVIAHEIVTHVVLVYLRSDDRLAKQPVEPLIIGLIRGDKKWVKVDRSRLQAG